jgi:hypothetical protein
LSIWIPLTSEEPKLQRRLVSVSGKLLMGLASTIILGSGLLETQDHTFLSHDCDWFSLVLSFMAGL